MKTVRLVTYTDTQLEELYLDGELKMYGTKLDNHTILQAIAANNGFQFDHTLMSMDNPEEDYYRSYQSIETVLNEQYS